MLNFFAPINNLGMGVHSLNLIRAYEDLGMMEVCLIPPFGGVTFQDDRISRWLRNRERFSRNDPSLMIFDIPFFANFSGKPKIGMAVFETDGVTAIQKAALRSCDILLTPSQWGRNVLEAAGFTASIVPEGIDPSIFHPDSNTKLRREPVFFHIGKFEERKGTLSVIRCFARALEEKEAWLLIHVRNPFLPDWRSRLEDYLISLGFKTLDLIDFSRRGLNIRLVSEQEIPVNEIARLYRNVDCGIFPSKGEGFGLPILECLASGTPVIAGRWSAMADYLPDNYPAELILKNSTIQKAEDGQWYHGDRGDWFVPDEEEIVEKIRYVYENARTLKESESWRDFVHEIAEEWTWANAAKKLDMVLETVM